MHFDNAPDAQWTLGRHQRIAFQFSGGRDSLAALFLLEPYWRQMTVYHLDHGDRFPETREVVQFVGERLPITTVRSDVFAVREAHGLPSDLAPADNTPMGRVLSGRPLTINSRFDCCSRSVMQPLHDRMRKDGMTLLIRGVRRSDFRQDHPFMSGWQGEGLELYYPIEAWTTHHVMEFLRARRLPIARFYDEGMDESPECMGCTAWWGDGRLAYMRRHYPEQAAVVTENLRDIRAEIDRQYGTLKEIDHG